MRGPLAAQRSVGTRGGVGWWRGPGACPGWSATHFPDRTHANRVVTRTSTRPPPVPTPPLVPTARTLGFRLPILVVKIHHRPKWIPTRNLPHLVIPDLLCHPERSEGSSPHLTMHSIYLLAVLRV